MALSRIRVLKPRIAQEEAVRRFSARGFSAMYWRLRSGPLQRIAEAYVPFWTYRILYELSGTRKTRYFALDAVRGMLDPFEFPEIPRDDELLTVETRNSLLACLDEHRAAELLREKVLRLIFQQGFFKLRALKLEIERAPCEIHVPYWLAFYGGNGAVRCRALDAVRRRIEGEKASAFFEQWLAA